jgi:hypothetical protein
MRPPPPDPRASSTFSLSRLPCQSILSRIVARDTLASIETSKEEVKMQKKEGDLAVRTKSFALRIIRLFSALPKTTEA